MDPKRGFYGAQMSVNKLTLAEINEKNTLSSLIESNYAHKVVQREDNRRMNERPNRVYRSLKPKWTGLLAQNRSFSTGSVERGAIYRVPMDRWVVGRKWHFSESGVCHSHTPVDDGTMMVGGPVGRLMMYRRDGKRGVPRSKTLPTAPPNCKPFGHFLWKTS